MRPLKKYNAKKKISLRHPKRSTSSFGVCTLYSVKFVRYGSMISTQPPLAQITSRFFIHSQLYAMTLAQKGLRISTKRKLQQSCKRQLLRSQQQESTRNNPLCIKFVSYFNFCIKSSVLFIAFRPVILAALIQRMRLPGAL